MDNFIATSIFILPGVMAYFWLQLFGMTPPVKHSAPEFTGIAALLWLPISFSTLLILNGWAYVHGDATEFFRVHAAWRMSEFKNVTSDLRYLFVFVIISAFTSFVLCALWVKWGDIVRQKAINTVRRWNDLSNLSDQPTVWEDLFHRDELQVVEISKIEKPDEKYIGSITKTSRPFETERAIVLEESKLWTSIVEKHKPAPEKIYIDSKSGMVVKIFKLDEVLKYADEDLLEDSVLLWRTNSS